MGRLSTQRYVIKEWFSSETPNQDGIYVHITGRKGGLVSWFLSLVGVDPTVSFIIDRGNVRFKVGSWTGYNSVVTPIANLCSGHYGYSKPVWGAAFWAIAGLALLLPTLGLSFILILGAIVYYLLNKTTELGVTYVSGDHNEFAFKRSVIEGRQIDALATEKIVAIIEMLVLGADKPRAVNVDAGGRTSGELEAFGEQARQKMEGLKAQAMRAGGLAASKVAASLATGAETASRNASATPPAAQPESAPSAASSVPQCPSCKGPIKATSAFCGNCGHKLR
jgi:hypothetical protein